MVILDTAFQLGGKVSPFLKPAEFTARTQYTQHRQKQYGSILFHYSNHSFH